jgi:hypothetical protein
MLAAVAAVGKLIRSRDDSRNWRDEDLHRTTLS